VLNGSGLLAVDIHIGWRPTLRLLLAGFLFFPFLCGLAPILLYEKVASRVAWHNPAFATAGAIGLAVLCCLFAFVRYVPEARAARIVVVGLAITLGIFGFALGDELGIAHAARAEALGNALEYLRLIALVASLLSILRPSFAIFPMVYFAFHKNVTRAVSGAEELGRNDYAPLVEVGLFLACGLIALGLLQSLGRSNAVIRKLPSLSTLGTRDFAANAAGILLLAAIGAHFGNYFMSGMAKITLDGGPLSWALENPTSSIMLAGYGLGAAPLAFSSSLLAAAYEAFRAVQIPMNFVVLSAQLLCFLAFLRRRWLIGLTAFFDFMHISIFLLSGALFLHWIILNSLIVAGLARVKDNSLSRAALLTGIVVTIFGHTVFYNARLGWYDARQIRQGYFEAVAVKGDWIRVAPSFFRDASYLLYVRHFGYHEYRRKSGHIPTSAWGQIGIRGVQPQSSEFASSNYEVMKLTKNCAYPVEQPFTPPDYDVTRPASFILGQHERAVTLASSGFSVDHNLYPHHHYSMPFLHRPFEALDPREIVAYRYNVDTICLEVTDGKIVRRVMTQTLGPRINVRQ
jgi:hypothetical protein